MNSDDIQRSIQKAQLEDDMRKEFESTIEDRVVRYLEVKPHEIVAHTHFSRVSAEISTLFRDGQFYGCIALSQAVGEALVRYMCQQNGFKPGKVFENNLQKLSKRRFLTTTVKNQFNELWIGRDDYHHLNPNIEQDHNKLKELAGKKARLLMEIEKEIFGYTVNNGTLALKYPKYWEVDDKNQIEAFLRIDP